MERNHNFALYFDPQNPNVSCQYVKATLLAAIFRFIRIVLKFKVSCERKERRSKTDFLNIKG
jgi:hypothetical protein